MMTDDERVLKLAEYLGLFAWTPKPSYSHYGPPGRIAAGIIANAKAHLDALVEAGVVEHVRDWPESGTSYYLPKPKPHVHEPYVSEALTEHSVLIRCLNPDCTETHRLPNRLPIEWPDDE
jgi:hypothetical protein